MTPGNALRVICAALCSLCVIASASASPSASDLNASEYTERELGEIRDQAIHILGGNANVVSRWNGEITYGLVTETTEEHLESQLESVLWDVGKLINLPTHRALSMSVKSYMQQLQNSPPHSLSDCVGSDCVRLIVVVSDLEDMEKIASAVPLRAVYQTALSNENADKKAVCFFAPYQRASVILQALIFVRNDLPASLISTCLHEEIYQAFGLFNDFDTSTYFSFNNQVENKQITPLDKKLLSTLYEFNSGAPAYAVALRLIERLQAGN